MLHGKQMPFDQYPKYERRMEAQSLSAIIKSTGPILPLVANGVCGRIEEPYYQMDTNCAASAMTAATFCGCET